MKLEITTFGPVANVQDLARLEEFMGRPLPEQYREFLLVYNGGQPEPHIVDIEGAPFVGTGVNTLHGFDPDPANQANDLFWNLNLYEECRELQLLPIAHDAFGEVFALDLTEASYGRVYYFDSSEMPRHRYLVANDFNEFLSKLRGPTPEELGED